MCLTKSFQVKTKISSFTQIDALAIYLKINSSDLIITERRVYVDSLQQYCDKSEATVIFKDDFIQGANSYESFLELKKYINCHYERVIGIGGGGTLDLAKLLAIDTSNLKNLFFEKEKPCKIASLYLVPTTPGTGSEVTPFCALYFEDRGLQFLLSSPELFADEAILCPKFLVNIPFDVLLASSFDAFVHAFESYLSPLATYQSSVLSLHVLESLLKIFVQIANKGQAEVDSYLEKIQLCGNLAGIAYANAGCAAVHALAYPLSSRLKIHHGEANYLVFYEVLQLYFRKKPEGKISNVRDLMAKVLMCDKLDAFAEFAKQCDYFMPKKALGEYGMKESQILEFTDMVLSRQHMLIANGYETLSASEIADIYQNIL